MANKELNQYALNDSNILHHHVPPTQDEEEDEEEGEGWRNVENSDQFFEKKILCYVDKNDFYETSQHYKHGNYLVGQITKLNSDSDKYLAEFRFSHKDNGGESLCCQKNFASKERS